MTAPAWWAAVPDVTTEIDCRGARHELRWSHGALHVPAHGDVEAEQALGALGGDLPECLRLRAAWVAHAGDPALVTLGRRPGEAGLGFSPEDRPPPALALHTPPVRRGPPTTRRDELVTLLTLPVAFIDRLVLTAMARAASEWPDPAFRERHGLRLGAALGARATPALRRLGATLAAPDEDVIVHCTPAGPATRPAVRAERTGRGIEVTASLPLGWLPRVWGPGLSEPDGRFVLALRRADDGGRTYGIDVIEWVATPGGRWEGERRPATLVCDDELGSWRVRFDDGG